MHPPAQTTLRAAENPGCWHGRAAAGRQGMSLQGSPPQETCPAPAQPPSLQKIGCSCASGILDDKTVGGSSPLFYEAPCFMMSRPESCMHFYVVQSPLASESAICTLWAVKQCRGMRVGRQLALRKGSLPGTDLAHVLARTGARRRPSSSPAAAHTVTQLLLLRLHAHQYVGHGCISQACTMTEAPISATLRLNMILRGLALPEACPPS